MNTAKPLTLWSLRTSIARGHHFVAERQVLESNAKEWLDTFRKDEPGVLFIVSTRKPKLPA